MMTQPSHSIAAHCLAALAMVLTLGLGFALADAAAKPAAADSSQWMRPQPTWWGQSNGWRRHMQWRNQWHHRRHFNNGFHHCFGDCRCPIIIFNGSGFFFGTPGLVIANPRFIVRQPAFVVQQPTFVVHQPAFVVRQPVFGMRRSNFMFVRPGFTAGTLINRHPSANLVQPTLPRPLVLQQGFTNRGGVRIIAPGMN